MDRSTLIQQLNHYQSISLQEKRFIPSFLSLLAHEECFNRSSLIGHFTGSAWIVNENFTKVVLLHHKKLNLWLQPGGHADGEQDLCKVASEEAMEETGLSSLRLFNADIFDLDIHLIPKHKQVPAHYHYDLRYIFTADGNEQPDISDESNEVAWVDINDVKGMCNASESIMRMVSKSRSLGLRSR